MNPLERFSVMPRFHEPRPIILLLAILAGCGPSRHPTSTPSVQDALVTDTPPVAHTSPTDPGDPRAWGPITFQEQVLPFQYERGATGKFLPVEATGGGVGLLDYDADGDLDLFFAQGGPVPFELGLAPPADVLLRNEGGRRFTDVSHLVGLAPKGYGQGVAIADSDADGDQDVYVTRYGANTLWINDRGQRFVDATLESATGCELWSLGAAFLDYDRDGDQDLFVANYFSFDPAAAPFHVDDSGQPDYGLPNQWDGVPDVLYRNEGHNRFIDVSHDAGISDQGRGMGVLAADFDQDGWIDILVANDAQANALWRNNRDGTFQEIAELAGIGYNAAGATEANMGIAHGDTNEDGRRDLLITHLFGEHDTLWRLLADPRQELVYQDQTKAAGLGTASLPLTTWGTSFADFDHDGLLDLIVVAGHIRRAPSETYRYENPPLLMRQLEGGHFEDVTRPAGPFFNARHQCRGLATGDLDLDGDLDVVVVRHHAPAVILWNTTGNTGSFLQIDLRGANGNTDPVGALVELTTNGITQIRGVDSGGGYISASSSTLHFGLGHSKVIDLLRVRWPSGKVQEARRLAPGTRYLWRELEDPAPSSGLLEHP